jgi:hypothetical protein
MRVRDTVIGALNLFGDQAGAVPDTDLYTAQAFADIATISIIKDRTASTMNQLVEQLQTALNSRVVIEQAKGMLAARLDIDTTRPSRGSGATRAATTNASPRSPTSS